MQKAARVWLIVLALAVPLSALAEPMPVMAGAGKVRLDPKPGMPLSGYFNRYSKGNEGVHDPVFARALVLEAGERRAGLVNADLLLVTIELRDLLLSRVSDLELDFLVVTATHTHCSIGGYVDNRFAELAVMGRFDPEALAIVLDGMEAALREAAASLQPARIGAGVGEAPGVSANRRHLEGITDPELRVLAVWDQEGNLMAAIMNHAVHPTTMPASTMLVSGDLAGAAEAMLEERHPGAVVMFMNAGLGDQGPALKPTGPDDWEPVQKMGRALADRTGEVMAGIEPRDRIELEFYERPFTMPEPYLNPDFKCWLGLNPLVERLGRGMIRSQGLVMGLAIDEALLLFCPGEIGYEVQAALEAAFPERRVMVVSHANDYYGYVLMPEDYESGGYESCMNFYGPGFAPVLIREFEKMLGEEKG